MRFLRSLRPACRSLFRERGFALVTILTIALGVGSTTAVFSVVRGILLRPLPFPEEQRLVVVWERNAEVPKMFASPPNFDDWRRDSRTLELGAFNAGNFLVRDGEGTSELRGASMSAGLFELLRVRPIAGRGLTPADDEPGAAGVALIGERWWRSRYAADESVIGRSLEIGGRTHRIAGVMPEEFGFPPPIALEGTAPAERAQIWIPLQLDPAAGQRGAHYLTVIGRMRPGADMASAGAEIRSIARGLAGEYPETNAGWDAHPVPLRDEVVGSVRGSLRVLFGAVGLVLLIACVNVAHLVLARSQSRLRQLAMRKALGAGNGQIVSELIAESAVLAGAGGLLGIALAWWGVQMVVLAGPAHVPRVSEVAIDPAVLAFALAASALSAMLFSVIPAIAAVRVDPNHHLRGSGKGTPDAGSHRLGSAAVVAQIALALVLLIGAGLFARSLLRLGGVDVGFRREGILTARITLPLERYGDESTRPEIVERILRTLDSATGVRASGMIHDLPLDTDRQGTTFRLEGDPADRERGRMNFSIITPGYASAMGVRLREGRDFRWSDRPGSERVVLVNQAFGEAYFPGGPAVGLRLLPGNTDEGPWTVVGVLDDERHDRIEREAFPNVYFPYAQFPKTRSMSLAVHVDGPVRAAAGPVESAVLAVEPDAAVRRFRTAAELLSAATAGPRFAAVLFGVFAAIAVAMAVVGVYGVLAYRTRRRMYELGIRSALGAGRTSLVVLVLREALLLAAIGIAAGVPAAALLSRLAASLLYGVTPFDFPTYAGLALLLGAAVTLAALVPALRASRVPPRIVLEEGAG